MEKQDLRIVFMGTPEFAVASLRALVEGDYNVVAVVTMPDKPAGRGHHMITSAVKDYALSVGLPVLQPERLKAPEFISQLSSLNAQLFIVVAFRMLPEVVWSMPALGTFNLHGSLLPKYRGAAPINWAVINGETETGVTTFFLKHEIDTGDLILQERLPIGDDENVGSVHDRMMVLGARLVLQTVDLIIDSVSSGKPVPCTPQTDESCPAPKIFKETCRIDLSRTAREVKNFVRGLSPYPGAWTDLQVPINSSPKIREENRSQERDIDNNEGHVLTFPATKIFEVRLADRPSPLMLHCADGDLEILSLQVPGKKRLTANDFLNGLH